MWRAEDAWRAELAATTVGDMVVDFLTARLAGAWLQRGLEWVQEVDVTAKEQDMKVFVAGATGVLGRAAVPAAGRRRPRGARRRPAPRRPTSSAPRGPSRSPSTCSTRRRCGPRSTAARASSTWPPTSRRSPRAWKGSAWATNDRLRREGTQVLADACRDAGVEVLVKETVSLLLRGRRRPVDRRGLADRAPGPSAARRSTPRTPRSPSPATGAAASCCGSASSTRTTPGRSRSASRLAKLGFGPMVGPADGYACVDPRRRRRHRGGRRPRRAGRRLQRGRRAHHQRRVERRLRRRVRLQEAAAPRHGRR